LLLGHVTYEGFAAAWPGRSDAEMLADIRHEGGAAEPDDMAGFADRMNSIPKYVVSTTLETAEWNSSTIISDNVAEEVTRLKQLPGQDILVAGSAELVHTLAQHDLVDEYRLMIYPILVGQGKLLFSDAVDMTTLRLVDSKVFSTGVVVLTYAPARDAS
jgi:dihydrofolate reductase